MTTSNPYGRPPHHRDFDLLSEAIVQGDAMSDSGAQTIDQQVSEVADPETVKYFTGRRAAMVARAARMPLNALTMGALGACWLEGLVVGYRLRQAHEKIEREDEEGKPICTDE